ncbi:MarR family transcriptional regulator [Streptomyces sp. RLB1-33]|uniref:MarR family winged helix-turn-helix transcriptional regulator n=1 Tax=Streptomyces mirabilis TaxID=68239 RepID=UPI00143EE0E8|nr:MULTISPECIES: MarR family transcriptional regulator [Streptomyces]QIY71304.1 MarR family transcriptional regulator [Streptomyces sp. RLB1-33]QUW81737.1 MarR family transcriptional regulator [Streptomyces mirabilis]
MSTSVDDAVRALLLLMPRMVGRAKRIPVPEELQSLALAPRHLSLLSYLLFDGPLTVNDLAARLEVAPTTVSLMVGELSGKGILERREDPADRRRRIVSITDAQRPSISAWLARGATAWRQALEPLTPDQRQLVIDTLRAYEAAAADTDSAPETEAAPEAESVTEGPVP